jgi:hypothetical protein
MNTFEKIVFLEMTNKQFAKFQDSEYYETYKKLTAEEKDIIDLKISKEIHEIWSWINSKQRKGIHKMEISSIEEYNEHISPVSEIILSVSSDFGLSLKRELSEKFKNAIMNMFGKEYLDNFIKKLN